MQMELKYLKELYVKESHFRSSSPLPEWMTKQLPNLEALIFIDIENNETSCILDALQNHDVCFQEKLKEFEMPRCNLDDNRLETIFLEILPKFRNISSLYLVRNKI